MSQEELSTAPSFEKEAGAANEKVQYYHLPSTNPSQLTQMQALENPAEETDLEAADLERHLSRKSTKVQRLEPEKYPLIDLDNGLVGWDHQDDPANPRFVLLA